MKDIRTSKNPLSERYEEAEWLPHHFAPNVYGVKFPDGTIYNPAKIAIKLRKLKPW